MPLSRPLRILFILNASGGGATQGIMEFIRSCSRKEVTAFLITPENPNEQQESSFNTFTQSWDVIPLNWWNLKSDMPLAYRILVWGRNTLRSGFRIRNLIKLNKKVNEWQIDIVYTSTSLIIEGALIARIKGLPHVWHLKETFGKKGRVKFPVPDKLLPHVFVGLSSQVIVMTRFIQSFLGPLGNDQKVEIIYDGIRVKEFTQNQQPELVRSRLGLNQDDLLLGMVASLSATWKNHQVLIHAMLELKNKYPNIKLAAFGTIPKKPANSAYASPYNYYRSLVTLVQENDLIDHFIWAGFEQNIPRLMQAIDILVHPCEIEPFGRISIEAMAAGTPVIGPNEGGVSEAVVHQKTGILVPANQAIAFSRAIEFMFENRSLIHKYGQAGQCYIKENSQFQQDFHNLALLEAFKKITA